MQREGHRLCDVPVQATCICDMWRCLCTPTCLTLEFDANEYLQAWDLMCVLPFWYLQAFACAPSTRLYDQNYKLWCQADTVKLQHRQTLVQMTHRWWLSHCLQTQKSDSCHSIPQSKVVHCKAPTDTDASAVVYDSFEACVWQHVDALRFWQCADLSEHQIWHKRHALSAFRTTTQVGMA